MYDFTQKYYDLIMDYVGLNQRSAGLLATTKYTGFVRWHNRNHEIYDEINADITKYISNMYSEYATQKMVNTYNYSMPSSIMSHLENWKNAVCDMKIATKDMYDEACKCGDFILADKFKELNKIVNNELLYLKRVVKRLKDTGESDVMYVNKLIHDYFAEHAHEKFIDLSI